MSKYVKVADRKSLEHKEWLRTKLRKRAEDGSDEALNKLAEIEIVEQRSASKVGPLQHQIDEQAKRLRNVQAELATAKAEFASAQARIAELETHTSDLTIERDGAKGDLVRLNSALLECRNDVITLNSQARSAEAHLLDANKRVEDFTFNLQAIVPSFKKQYALTTFDDAFIVNLFFALGDRAVPDFFVALGWTKAKFDRWQSWNRKAHKLPTDKIIDLLHRSNCSCTQHEPETIIRDEGERRVLTDDDRVFLGAFLKYRGTDADLEIRKLIAQHAHAWQERNRRTLELTPPVSHREFTPFASTPVVGWNEY